MSNPRWILLLDTRKERVVISFIILRRKKVGSHWIRLGTLPTFFQSIFIASQRIKNPYLLNLLHKSYRVHLINLTFFHRLKHKLRRIERNTEQDPTHVDPTPTVPSFQRITESCSNSKNSKKSLFLSTPINYVNNGE